LSTRRSIQVLVVVLALALVSSAGATTAGPNGRIAYSSQRSGYNLELYSANADGTAERRLTWTNDSEQYPTWSPDGTKIAYSHAAANGGRWRIWVMNADGTDQKQLTSTPDYDSSDEIQPQWSPDGTQIAFASTRITTWNVWSINADGTGLRRVTTFLSNDPTWSPDGRQIAYVGPDAIGIVNADGTNPHPVTGPGGWAGAPSWSPDGSRLVFYRNNDRGYPGELYLINVDGSNETQLTTGGFSNGSPSWSPDGTRIVFWRSTQPPADGRLWTIGADGSNPQQFNTTVDNGPDWGTSQVVPEISPPDAPTIDILSPEQGRVYLPGTPLIAYYQCSSFVSYIVKCEGDLPLFATLDLSTSGTHSFTVHATDADGRTATKTVTFEVPDITPPQIDLRTPSSGATYQLGANVTIDYSCSDPGGSGVIFCGGDLPNGSPLDTSHAGSFSFSVTAADNARHVTQTHVSYTIVDLRPPRVEIQSPLADHQYTLGSSVAATYYCWSPGNIRIASCTGTVASGDNFDTSSIGPHSFSVTATDANGKTTTGTAQYRVVYPFTGFDSPVDTGGNLTGVRAGEGIALKFSLGGDRGLGAVTGAGWQSATCGDWTPTSGSLGADAKLSYKASTDRYQELVATSSSWKGACRILQLDLADGTHPQVRVSFK
jgi:hypothetical protein